MRASLLRIAGVLALVLVTPTATTGEWSGFVSFESRFFPSNPQADDRAGHDFSLSLSLAPEYYREWRGGDRSLVFSGFLRIDQHDGERSHADLRELYWRRVGRDWELTAGVRKVFWGVTESQHLVDILNQTDLVEDLDGEQKLGQPMVGLSLVRRWGRLDLFLLPGFRERTFPGAAGRIRTSPRIDSGRAGFESAAGRGHVDWAVRWSRSAGAVDVGLAHFEGTGREPRLLPALAPSGEPTLRPFYEQIAQSGLDLQVTRGGWLWKLEALSRRDRRERFAAAVGGLEYTFHDAAGSGIDLGLLAEALYDERRDDATTPFAEDLFLAARLALNDVQGTELLAGVIVDRATRASFWSLEGSRRLGRGFKLSLRVRALAGVPEGDLLRTLRRDDYVELALARYF